MLLSASPLWNWSTFLSFLPLWMLFLALISVTYLLKCVGPKSQVLPVECLCLNHSPTGCYTKTARELWAHTDHLLMIRRSVCAHWATLQITEPPFQFCGASPGRGVREVPHLWSLLPPKTLMIIFSNNKCTVLFSSKILFESPETLSPGLPWCSKTLSKTWVWSFHITAGSLLHGNF